MRVTVPRFRCAADHTCTDTGSTKINWYLQIWSES
jgi:hypothetical protein